MHEIVRRLVTQSQWPAVPQPQVKHLIEIAVEQIAFPRDADQVTTHQIVERVGIKGRCEQLHVFGELSISFKTVGKPGDRHIGDRVQTVKGDAEALAQLSFIIRL